MEKTKIINYSIDRAFLFGFFSMIGCFIIMILSDYSFNLDNSFFVFLIFFSSFSFGIILHMIYVILVNFSKKFFWRRILSLLLSIILIIILFILFNFSVKYNQNAVVKPTALFI